MAQKVKDLFIQNSFRALVTVTLTLTWVHNKISQCVFRYIFINITIEYIAYCTVLRVYYLHHFDNTTLANSQLPTLHYKPDKYITYNTLQFLSVRLCFYFRAKLRRPV